MKRRERMGLPHCRPVHIALLYGGSLLLLLLLLGWCSGPILAPVVMAWQPVGPTARIGGASAAALGATTRQQQQPQPQNQDRSPQDLTNNNKNSNTINGSSAAGAAGFLVTQSDAAQSQQLFSAFASLDLKDQYDAVLSSACAKILDSAEPSSRSASDDSSDDPIVSQLKDCQRLLQEMNDANVAASPRSMMALVDSAVKTQNAPIMASVLSQCLRNPSGIAEYGSRQADLLLFPSTATSKIRSPTGRLVTARQRLDAVPDLPVDDRVAEVTAALVFVTTIVACESTNLLGLSDISPVANLILAAMVGVVAIDNFYDLIQTGSQFLMNQIGNNISSNKDSSNNNTNKNPIPQFINFQLPDKADLPAGLGTGAATGRIVRGLTRLGTVDPEREAAGEAAALYTAYVLGLPCFAYRPNAYEAAVLVQTSVHRASSEKGDGTTAMDSLGTDAGILRMLVWLLAPVAMESASHAQLLMADPREASGFLTRLEEQMGSNNSNDNDDDNRTHLFWKENNSTTGLDRNDLLKWAYAEADRLLRDNKATVQEIANRLSGGAATVGDCVAVIEKW